VMPNLFFSAGHISKILPSCGPPKSHNRSQLTGDHLNPLLGIGTTKFNQKFQITLYKINNY